MLLNAKLLNHVAFVGVLAFDHVVVTALDELPYLALVVSRPLFAVHPANVYPAQLGFAIVNACPYVCVLLPYVVSFNVHELFPLSYVTVYTLATVIAVDVTDALPKCTAFLTTFSCNVNVVFPSVSVPFTVTVYLYPFVICSFATFVTVIYVFDVVILLIFIVLFVNTDSLSVHVNVICAVSLFAIDCLFQEPKLQLGALLSISSTSISAFTTLSNSSLNHT